MSHYLVTGGAGFIGSHLTDALLACGHAVTVLDNLSTGRTGNVDPRARLVVGDAADPALLDGVARGCDGIFHLAAVASVARANEDWLGTHRSNLTATICVLDAARRHGRIPVVYASSAAIYGDQGEGAIGEGATPRPQSAYGADKLGSELHAAVAFGVHGVPTTGFRFFNVYGPRQDPRSPYSGVISIFAERIAAGRPITIHGDGSQMRDFIYVNDIVRVLIAGIERRARLPGADVFNACTGRALSVLGLARTLGEVSGREPAIAFGPARPGDIRASLGDAGRMEAALGVSARTGLAEGLRQTLASLAAGE